MRTRFTYSISITNWAQALMLLVLGSVVWMGGAGVACAQSAEFVTETESSAAQFVFVIDDSCSMSTAKPHSDVNRFAVFAVDSMLSMLDDRDQVTVVGLNDHLKNRVAPDVRPLAQNRAPLKQLLKSSGPIAEYSGGLTPCATALKTARDRLNDVYTGSMKQVVFFLTDGQCEGPNQGQYLEDPELGFETTFTAHADGNLQINLLHFEAFNPSNKLKTLARKTGGVIKSVRGDRPLSLMRPFAEALCQAQGCVPEILEPNGTNTLDAYKGSSGVRVLAVAPDTGAALTVQVPDVDQGGPSLDRKGDGRFQFRSDTKAYQWSRLDYSEAESKFRVSVTGPSRWALLVLPEYRLKLHNQIYNSLCSDIDRSEMAGNASSGDVGSPLCVVAQVLDEQGRNVSEDIAKSGQASIAWCDVDRTDCDANHYTYDPTVDGFKLEKRRPNKGDYLVYSQLVLGQAKNNKRPSPPLKSRSTTFSVSSSTIGIDPSNMPMPETLVPGEEVSETLTMTGNFSPKSFRVSIDRDDLPECVEISFFGKKDGEEVQLSSGQSGDLHIDIQPFCGDGDLDQGPHTYDPKIKLESFETGPNQAPVQLKVQFELDNQFRFELDPAVTVTQGDEADLSPVVFQSNAKKPAYFKIYAPDGGDAWPDGLSLDNSLSGPFAVGARFEEPIYFQAKADSCCTPESYSQKVRFQLVDKGGSPIMGANGAAILTQEKPVRITVEQGSWWACFGSYVLTALKIGLVLFLIWWIVRIYQLTFWFKRNNMPELYPMVWDSMGDPEEVAAMRRHKDVTLKNALKPIDRLIKYLSANPLILPFTKQEYRETLTLTLRKSTNHRGKSASLLSGRDLRKVAKRGGTYKKQSLPPGLYLFAGNRGGGSPFVHVLGTRRPPVFHLTTSATAPGEEPPEMTDDADPKRAPRPETVSKGQAYCLWYEEPSENEPAGWNIKKIRT